MITAVQEIAGAVASSNHVHRPALELKRLPELLHRIDGYKGRPLTLLTVELTLLIFIRSSELRFVRWSEIDFEAAMWTIPLFAAELLASAQYTIRKAITLLERLSREPGVSFTSRHDVRDWLRLQAPS